MSKPNQLFKLAQSYIQANNLDMSVEELFVHFKEIIEIQKEFEKYLLENGLNEPLEKMKRNKRFLEKRRLFGLWYSQQNQNKKDNKEIVIDLSEILFVSCRTVENNLYYETTESKR